MEKFRKELEVLINQNSIENGSNTPDFILAEYLTECLKTFDKITYKREEWYGRGYPQKRDSYSNIDKESSYNPSSFSHDDTYYKYGNAEGDDKIDIIEQYGELYSRIGNSHPDEYFNKIEPEGEIDNIFHLLDTNLTETNTLTFKNNHVEMIKLCQNGDIFVKGKIIENDIEVVDAMREFLKMQNIIK